MLRQISPLVILHILSPVPVFFGPHISDGGLARCWCDLVKTLSDMCTEPLRGVITRCRAMILHNCPARFDGLEFRMILGVRRIRWPRASAKRSNSYWGFGHNWRH